MTRLSRFARSYPLVAVTLAVLALVLGLHAAGLDAAAAVIATVYVAGNIAWAAVGMVREVLRGHFGLDILAVVAMTASLLVGEHLAALIIVLMLTGGEALEDFAAARARRELTALLEKAPQTAHLLGADGEAREVPAAQVRPGDELLVKPNEVVPVDAELLSAEAAFDESSLTGESLPSAKAAGDAVLSGSVNGTAAVRVRATAAAADSQYQRIVELVEQAHEQKAPVVRLADRFALPFTAVSLAIAGVAWWASGDPVRFAEVLVLATPCPLLIAAPVAFLGGMSQASRRGVIVKGGGVLESLAHARAVAFDKTGTLTHGRPRLQRVEPAEGFTADAVLAAAAAAEAYSTHVMAEAVVRAADDAGLARLSARGGTEEGTRGVRALVRGTDGGAGAGTGTDTHEPGAAVEVRVGKLAFVREVAPDAPEARFAPGETAAYVSVDGRHAGTLVLADALRENAGETVAALRAEGFERAVMLTGDNEHTARSLAAEAGLDDVAHSLLPEDKVRLLAELQPRPVIMVGDGVNDATVLAAADVGIAMGARGSSAAGESADVVITRDDIGRTVEAVRIGRHTYRIALQAVLLGVALSVGLMLVAAFGHIPAVAGALTQELVDLACILYALRARTSPRGTPQGAAARARGRAPQEAARA